MTKAEAMPKAQSERKGKTWAEFIGVEKYAYQIYRLQNEAGLTFKEARAILTPHQGSKALAEEWGCTIENVYNLARKGREKVNELTGGDAAKNEDLMPSYMWYAP